MSADITDRRLLTVLDGLKAGRAKVLSVDVFDTLLWRRVPEAKDVFPLLGRRLKAQNSLAGHVSPLDFAELRRAAERRAREKKQAVTGYREIRLADIYAEIPDFIFAPGFSAPARAAAELDLEGGLMLLDRGVAKLMAAARGLGIKVILVSDTYFCTPEIEGFMLKAAGALPEYDRLIASCEFGKPKWRDLFDALVKEMGVAPAEIIHIGDTLEADVAPCRRLGMGCLHYDKWSFSPRVREAEFPEPPPERAALLGARGDFGLTGARSRLFHRPPADLPEDLRFYWSYGAAVLGPVFAAFARWIVAACREAGVTRVHGIMREGRFLNRIVSDTARQLNVPLATEELWMSRRAVMRAGLYSDDPGSVPDVAILSPGLTTDEVLANMGLTRADLGARLPPTFDLGQPDSLVVLCAAIASVPGAFDKVLAMSAAERRKLLAALRPLIAAARAEPVAVMDLGYAATIQAVLERILEREGEQARFIGLYLALNDKAMGNIQAGVDLRSYLNSGGYGAEVTRLLTRTSYLLEHACMCREGSLAGFDEAGRPVLLPNQRDDVQLRQMEALQDGIAAGVAATNGLLGDLAQTPANDEALKRQVAAIITACHLYPTRQEAENVGGWRHEGKVHQTAPYRLTDLTFDSVALEYGGWAALQKLSADQVYWPAAALTLADPFIADVYAGGFQGAYSAAHLASGPMIGILTIRPDSGAGFDPKAEGRVPLMLNVFGRGQVGITVKPFGPKVYRRLQFHWHKAAGVAQIDEIIATYVGENDRRQSETLPSAALAWTGSSEIAPGVHMVGAGGAETVVNLNPPAWLHAVELIVRYKYLRLEGMFGKR